MRKAAEMLSFLRDLSKMDIDRLGGYFTRSSRKQVIKIGTL